jgi:hypothetical protein
MPGKWLYCVSYLPDLATMKDAVADRYNRLKRAAQIISNIYDNPDQKLIRLAENAGCLDELEFLLEESRKWLDDDDYFGDVAWTMVNDPGSLVGVC